MPSTRSHGVSLRRKNGAGETGLLFADASKISRFLSVINNKLAIHPNRKQLGFLAVN